MKQIIFGLSVLVFPFLALAQSASFPDVSRNNIYSESVSYLKSKAVVEGYKDGYYRPKNNINRAEFTKILVASQFNQLEIDTCNLNSFSFTDVPKNAWFAPYICVAKSEGIVDGYPDGTFKPGQNIIFSEAAKIIAQSFNLPLEELQPWYAPFVQILSDRRAIPFDIDKVEKAITRGEMAELIFRIMTNRTDKPSREFNFRSYASLEGIDPYKDKFFLLLNQVRRANNLPSFKRDVKLEAASQYYSERMNEEEFFHYIDPQGKKVADRAREVDYDYMALGENTTVGDYSPAGLITKWRGSENQWKDVMNPNFLEVGIGRQPVTKGTYYKGAYWVVMFGQER